MVGDAEDGVIELFVPGRLCLFGEHSDWAGEMRRHNPEIAPGRTIVAGLDYGLHARVRPLHERVLRLRCTTDEGQVEEAELPLDEAELAAVAQRGGFFSYAAGVAYYCLVHFHVGGLLMDNHATTLPMKKGLSSSAALCVLVARAFNRCNALGLTERGEMQAAYEGERLTPSQCGRMDQAVAFGPVPVVMTYEGDVLQVERLQLGAPLHLVLVDLRASKNTVGILSALQAAYPHPQTEQQRGLVELLGPINQRITGAAAAAMAAGDVERVGALMREAQREFDARAGAVCPQQLGLRGSPVLHKVLAYEPIQRHVWGGKGVGSQGDGTAQLLCRDGESQAAVCSILTADLGVHCMPFTLQPAAAAPAALEPADGSGSEQQLTAARLRQLQQARAKFERLHAPTFASGPC